MTSAVPNRTHIEGKVVSIEDSAHLDDFSVLKIKTRQISSVADFANLIKQEPNESLLQVHIAKEVLHKHKLKEGSDLSAQIRKSPKDLFIIPDSVVVQHRK